MPAPAPVERDDIVVLYGLSWQQYEAIREATDHIAGLHLTFLEGTLEILKPSRRHERIKKLIARLLECWAAEHDLRFTGFGSTTYRRPEMERALEPDECYVLGDDKATPDLAIEVVITGRAVDKLDVYRGLGVGEVWFWVDGRIGIYVLGAGSEGYAESPRSRLLPDLDPIVLAGVIAEAGEFEQTQAVKAFREKIRRR